MNQSMEIIIPCISTEKKNRLGREGYAPSFYLDLVPPQLPPPLSPTPITVS